MMERYFIVQCLVSYCREEIPPEPAREEVVGKGA
jgi:hypothetical protein